MVQRANAGLLGLGSDSGRDQYGPSMFILSRIFVGFRNVNPYIETIFDVQVYIAMKVGRIMLNTFLSSGAGTHYYDFVTFFEYQEQMDVLTDCRLVPLDAVMQGNYARAKPVCSPYPKHLRHN